MGKPAPSAPVAPELAAPTLPGPLEAPWPQYHRDGARSGVLPRAPGASFHLDWRAIVDGDVYASPLVAGGLVVIATENDTVYALDATSGQLRWRRHLGSPVAAASLPCGDIDPVSGITGTPAADPATGTLYVVAFTQPAAHRLYALDLSSGAVRGSVGVDPPGETPQTQQQRGALALSSGHVYVPFGGLFGDCGAYHGWVVGVPVAGGPETGYRVPCDRECGIWAPAGPVVDAAGDLLVATGNGEPFDRYTEANSVLRLGPGLELLDSFAPADWADLSRSDVDLGSISPVLLDGGLLWISGKGGQGYILRQDHLGGIGGQAYQGTACRSFSGALYTAPLVYLACAGELTAFRIDLSRPSFSEAWKVSRPDPGGPIAAYGALWVVDTGAGDLAALNPSTGEPVIRPISGGAAMHFVTPAAGDGHVYAVLGRQLVAVAAASGG